MIKWSYSLLDVKVSTATLFKGEITFSCKFINCPSSCSLPHLTDEVTVSGTTDTLDQDEEPSLN